MPVLICPVTGCEWQYPCEFSNDQSVEIIKLHVGACHTSSSPTAVSAKVKAPKINRPMVDMGISQETWNMFRVRWKQFRTGVQICAEEESLQLFQCATEALGNLLLKADPFITDRNVEEVMSVLESFAVIRVSKGVQRADLMKLNQSSNEAIRTYAARVQGKAQTCGFIATGKCACEKEVTIDYTQEVIKDVILAGISDSEIQTSVLETEGIENRTLAEILSIIERKEQARKAYRSFGVSGVSNYKRAQGQNFPNKNDKSKPPRSKKIACPKCKQMRQRFRAV